MPGRRALILLLGDSITQLSFSAINAGWGAHLADIYQRRADVLNRGKSGYNTDWFLGYMNTTEGKQDIFGSDHNPLNVRIATIFFGANDASDPKLNPRHHVPLQRYKDNLKKIAREVVTHVGHQVKIIIICPPPVHHDTRLKFQVERWGADKATGELERTLELSGKYATAAAEVAAELNVPHLNLWKEMQSASPGPDEPWSKYLNDGLHLSREGNIFVGEKLGELIKRHFPELAVTPCPHTAYPANSASVCPELEQMGPWHDHINHTDPLKSFQKKRKLTMEDDSAEKPQRSEAVVRAA